MIWPEYPDQCKFCGERNRTHWHECPEATEIEKPTDASDVPDPAKIERERILGIIASWKEIWDGKGLRNVHVGIVLGELAKEIET